ncbi:FHA domain-containing protein [Spirulina sp. CCNP1310]|uniref:FHA domain-containing protein n=1 Tax=Spirulina sp. CCNP1310 TaxID=3110249 RepID=UPI002B1EF13E|nr:FHA domain-containing protein [Spirulina sp. CCNP1310]MEA5421235.1 FHA domain-containing protein [Spirulina sp. CCNP1310]
MIAVTLLHPSQSVPVQSWVFSDQSTINLGRGSQNDIVLYSAVVSRRHAILTYENGHWKLINQGTNGVYVDGAQIRRPVLVKDGMVIRFGESGPKLLLRLGMVEDDSLGKVVKGRSLTPQAVEHLNIQADLKEKLKTPKQDKSTFLE